ncbi:synaptotagmin-11 [Nematostella vectensis]|uniref:synaptotagmin-11 n=1 Tax=Nematostella vectensis TaxID=45351 RepID=UPI00138FA4FD|nr:synaptotagmin-11 [Nematostella vectensis]
MTTQVIIGIVSGLSAGLVIVIVYLLYLHFRQPKSGRDEKKFDDQKLRSRSIVQNEIPNFCIPTTFPLAIQEPHRHNKEFLESQDEFDSTPVLNHTVVQPPSSPRRCSVQLEQILTRSPAHQTGTPPQWQGKKRSGSTTALGQLEFSIFYDEGFKVLQVYVIKGMQIFLPGSEHPPDTFVRVSMTSGTRKLWEQSTGVAHRSCQPKYNEKLDFAGLDSNRIKECLLSFMVFEASQRVPISECVYGLVDLPFNVFVTEVLKLSDTEYIEKPTKTFGKLLIAMSHNPIDKKLTVRVDSARGLPEMSRRTTNAYIKVDIWFTGQKLFSRVTKVQYKSKSPIFNEVFIFDVSDDKLPQITISFRVKHHGKLREKHIGRVDLGANALTEIEYRHWEQVLDKPHLEIDQWHDIRSYNGSE